MKTDKAQSLKDEYRRLLNECRLETRKAYDKALLALAGGALAFSVTLAKELLSPPLHGSAYLILLAWIAWALTIVMVLVSFEFSDRSFAYSLQQVDSGGPAAGEMWGGKMAAWISKVNITASISFIVGIALFLIFVVMQLPKLTDGAKGDQMTDKDRATKTTESGGYSKKGLTVPQPQPGTFQEPAPSVPVLNPTGNGNQGGAQQGTEKK